MALCRGRTHEPRQPRMSHRLKTSKGKRAKRVRGGGEAAESFGGFSSVCVSVCVTVRRPVLLLCAQAAHTVCAQGGWWRGREERTSMFHERLLTLRAASRKLWVKKAAARRHNTRNTTRYSVLADQF